MASKRIAAAFILLTALSGNCLAQVDTFVEYFKACKVGSKAFDNCMKKALNDVRPYFPRGVPEMGVLPFDPFFAKEVIQKRGGPAMNYKLKLTNVYESGWTQSAVTKFRSDLKKGEIQYSQSFPEKFLKGEYEMEGRILQYPMVNKGSFNLTLYGYKQTTTVTRHPTAKDAGALNYKSPLKVRIVADSCRDMKLHISNLLGGRQILERMLDRVINASWEPGFQVSRPLIDDLVSGAFTDIFNKSFYNFPFEKLFPQ